MVTKNALSNDNEYNEVFDGRTKGITVEVLVPTNGHAKLKQTAIGDYLQFGKPIGEVGGKQMFFNTFVHGNDSTDLKKLCGKKVVGHPVVMEKVLPDGRTYYHLDVHLAKHNAHPSHRILTRVADAPPTISWWQRKARKDAPAENDAVLPLPAPATGFVAIVSL